MGRKRNQGKARRAAKAKAREEAKKEVDNQPVNSSDQSLSAAVQIQQFQIDEEKCKHGLFDPSISTDITQFVDKFHSSLMPSNQRSGLRVRLQAAHDATWDEFADVWNDSTKLEIAVSCFLCLGTQAILDNKYNHARGFALPARCLEQYIAVALKRTQAIANLPKVEDTDNADLHTLVKFFRHRIPCSCLDEKYEEVKHITKMGRCWNPKCSIAGRTVERSKIKDCSRCRGATYCSRECQESDWSGHKPDCDKWAAAKVKFDAKQKNM